MSAMLGNGEAGKGEHADHESVDATAIKSHRDEIVTHEHMSIVEYYSHV